MPNIADQLITSRINLTNPVNWNDPLNKGLVSWWLTLPQWSGGVKWFDLCRKNDGVLTGMDPPTDWCGSKGRPGGWGCLDFDGTDDYVDLSDSSSYTFGSGPFTLCVWVNLANLSGRFIAKDTNTARQWQFGCSIVTFGKVEFFNNISGAFVTGATTLSLGVWYHAVFTRAGTVGTLYLNGHVDGTDTVADNFNLVSKIMVGRREYLGFPGSFQGVLDSVRIYSRALSAAEVHQLYNDEISFYPRTLARKQITKKTFIVNTEYPVVYSGYNPGRINLTSPVNWNDPLNKGLVSWWLTLPQYSGGVKWFDLCRKNDGLLTGMDPPTDWCGSKGRPGGFGCLDFDGSNDVVTAGTPPTLRLTGDITVSVFARLTSNGGNPTLVCKDNGAAAQRGWCLDITPKVRFYCFNATTFYSCQSSINIPTNEWVHLVAVKSGTAGQIYINGIANGNIGTMPATMSDSQADCAIGGRRYSGTNSMVCTGALDSIRIYSRGLSAAEVYRLYKDETFFNSCTLNRIPKFVTSDVHTYPVTYSGYNPGRINLTCPINGAHHLAKGLVGWWLCIPSYSGGNTWFDLTRRREATLLNGAVISSGRGAPGGLRALSCDGIDDAVSCGNYTPINFGTGRFTIMFWVKSADFGTNRAILTKDNWAGGTTGIYFYTSTGGGQVFRYYTATTDNIIGDASTVVDNKWHHIAVVRHGTGADLTFFYVDGKIVNQTIDSRTLSNSMVLAFGNDSDLTSTRASSCLLNDIRFYNRALSDGEVFDAFASSKEGTYAPLVRKYPSIWNYNEIIVPPGPSGGRGGLSGLSGLSGLAGIF